MMSLAWVPQVPWGGGQNEPKRAGAKPACAGSWVARAHPPLLSWDAGTLGRWATSLVRPFTGTPLCDEARTLRSRCPDAQVPRCAQCGPLVFQHPNNQCPGILSGLPHIQLFVVTAGVPVQLFHHDDAFRIVSILPTLCPFPWNAPEGFTVEIRGDSGRRKTSSGMDRNGTKTRFPLSRP